MGETWMSETRGAMNSMAISVAAELIFVTLVVPVVSVRIPHSLHPSSYVRILVLVRSFVAASRSFC